MNRTQNLAVAIAAAALFSAGTVALTAAPAHAQVKCIGANACKGTSACKTAASACKGQNACKGHGWSEAANADACKAAGGIGIKFQS